jgi:hypothetical protein
VRRYLLSGLKVSRYIPKGKSFLSVTLTVIAASDKSFTTNKWPFNRLDRLKGQMRWPTLFLFVPLPGLLNQFNQTGNLRFGFGRHQAVKLIFG